MVVDIYIICQKISVCIFDKLKLFLIVTTSAEYPRVGSIKNVLLLGTCVFLLSSGEVLVFSQ